MTSQARWFSNPPTGTPNYSIWRNVWLPLYFVDPLYNSPGLIPHEALNRPPHFLRSSVEHMSAGGLIRQAKRSLQQQAKYAGLNVFVAPAANHDDILRSCQEASERQINGESFVAR